MMIRDKITINGLQLAVTRISDGRPFLFCHGLCGCAMQPAEVFPQDRGWQCLALESRGHGYAEIGDPAELSIRQFADDAALFLEQLNAGPAVIGGISMGAAIALRLAVIRPELACGLLLARPAWVDQPAPANLAPHRKIAALMATHHAASARLHFETTDTANDIAKTSPDNLTSLLGFFDRQPTDQTRKLLAAIGHDGPAVSRAEITAITLPTLVIATARDAVHPLSIAEELAKLIPNASLAQIASKSDNRDLYVTAFRAAIGHFLEERE